MTSKVSLFICLLCKTQTNNDVYKIFFDQVNVHQHEHDHNSFQMIYFSSDSISFLNLFLARLSKTRTLFSLICKSFAISLVEYPS